MFYFNRFTQAKRVLSVSTLTTSLALASTPLWAESPSTPSVVLNTPTADLQETNAVLTLDQAIQLAQQFSPLQALWQSRRDIAQGNLQQSGLWQNPEISIEQTGFKNTVEREQSFSVSQKLDLFGVLSAKKKLATIALDSEASMRLAYQSQLKLAVTAAYWRVAQAEWQLQLVQAQDQLSDASEQAAKRRLQAGRIAEVDYSRVVVAHQQVKVQLDAAKTALLVSRLQLSRLWGNTTPVFLSTTASTTNSWPVVHADQILLGLSDNPQQQLYRQQQKQAEVAVKLARLQALPQPTLKIGSTRTQLSNAEQGSNSNRLMVGLSVPLPLFDRHQGEIQARTALANLAALQGQLNLNQRQQQAQALLLQLDGLSSQYQQLITEQLPLAQQIQQKTLLGFEAGKFSITEVQQATRDYQSLQFNQLQLLSQAWQLSLQLAAMKEGLAADTDISNADAIDRTNSQLMQDSMSLPVIGSQE